MGGFDWAELALVSRLEQWRSAHPYFFIGSTARLVRASRVTATMQPVRVRDLLIGREPTVEHGNHREPTGTFRLVNGRAASPERGTRPLVLPLRKVQTTFPSMITVGRVDNNDLVVTDEQISKFHAYFRLVGNRVEVADAGSRNGTFTGGRRLEKGVATALSLGERVCFGAIEFQLFDARGCWEWLRRLDRFV